MAKALDGCSGPHITARGALCLCPHLLTEDQRFLTWNLVMFDVGGLRGKLWIGITYRSQIRTHPRINGRLHAVEWSGQKASGLGIFGSVLDVCMLWWSPRSSMECAFSDAWRIDSVACFVSHHRKPCSSLCGLDTSDLHCQVWERLGWLCFSVVLWQACYQD